MIYSGMHCRICTVVVIAIAAGVLAYQAVRLAIARYRQK